MLKESGLTLKVTAMESTHVNYFPHMKYKKASTSSTPPYNTHHTLRVMLYFFFFLEKVCWLPAKPVIMRHNSGHLGDVLIITADIYRTLIVYPDVH